MVAKEKDRGRIVDFRFRPEVRLEERGRHRRDVFVGEAVVRPNEAGVSGRDRAHAEAAGLRVGDEMPGEDFFRERHGAGSAARRRGHDLAREARDVVRVEAAALDDLARDLVRSLREFRKRDRLAPADPVDQRKIGRGEDAEVLAVLPVDPLDVLRDHEPDPGAPFRVRRLFARRALPAALSRDADGESPRLHVPFSDRLFPAAREADVRIVAQPLVEVVADPPGRDLVGRDVVPKRNRRVPVEILAFELPADELRIFRQEEDAAGKCDAPFGHRASEGSILTRLSLRSGSGRSSGAKIGL